MLYRYTLHYAFEILIIQISFYHQPLKWIRNEIIYMHVRLHNMYYIEGEGAN